MEYRRLPRASSCLGEIWLCREYDASETEQFFNDLNCAFSECSAMGNLLMDDVIVSINKVY